MAGTLAPRRRSRPARPHEQAEALPEQAGGGLRESRRAFAAYLSDARLWHRRASQLAYSTVCRYLVRHGVSRKRDILPPARPRRYERENPGELIDIDIKKLAKINGVGHRIHGDRSKGNGKGWEYLHVAIDDHSWLAYSEILPDESGDSSLIFARNAIKWFRKHGMALQSVMTDNRVGYKKRYRNRLSAWGIRHITTKPYTPQTNGKAERFIRTCLEEWAYVQPYAHSRERTKALPIFLDFYNNHRQHHGIDMQTLNSRCEQRHEM